MAKPKVFIGCSTGNLKLANALHRALDYDAECNVWNQGTFRASKFPLDSLEAAIDRADFAVFVCVPEDTTTMRNSQVSTVRDNVIFELGLAIGRIGRDRTFIVVPRDVQFHLPTDLKGLTPLDFDDDRSDGNLQSALAPLCDDLRTAMSEGGLRVKPTPPTVSDDESPSTEFDHDAWLTEFLTPDQSWEFDRLVRAWRFSIRAKKELESAALQEFFNASSFSKDPEKVAVWQSASDTERLKLGSSVPLQRFKERVGSFPNNMLLQRQLADAQTHYGDHEGAQRTLENAAKNATTLDLRGQALVGAASASRAAGLPVNLRLYVPMVFEAAKNSQDGNGALISALRDLADHGECAAIKSGLDEVLLKDSPDNSSLRFDLAHGYSESGRDELAVVHYEGIPPAQRSTGAWNNLGVSYSHLAAPGLAIESYRLSSEKGGTIALGNMARKLISAGFFKEARDLIERALAMPDHDENVDEMLPKIAEAKDAEAASIEEARKQGREAQKYMRSLGMAATQNELHDIQGGWNTPDCTVEFVFEHEAGEYVGLGRYTREASGLGLFSSPLSQKMDLEVRIRRIGNAFEGNIKRKPQGQATEQSIFAIQYNQQITLILSQDGQTMLVREGNSKDAAEVEWTRQAQLLDQGQPKAVK